MGLPSGAICGAMGGPPNELCCVSKEGIEPWDWNGDGWGGGGGIGMLNEPGNRDASDENDIIVPAVEEA